jgi:dihydroflavonol-4-reductase
VNKNNTTVAVLGGTGLIGWHTVNALRERGHGIRVLARSAPRPELGIGSTEYQQLNYITASHEDLVSALTGCTALVHAAGADPRIVPKGRADTFFHDINVTANQRLLVAAIEAKVTVTVLLTSYFHPLRPHMKSHPYVASRIASEAAAMALDNAGDIRVVILQPPYVFGAIPGRTTLGDNFALAARIPLLLPHGGTNAIGVSDFASAICGAIEREVHGSFLVGDENLSWPDLFARFGGRAWLLPTFLLTIVMACAKAALWLVRRQAGLDPVSLVPTITSEMYFDPAASQEALGYTRGNLSKAIASITEKQSPEQ